MYRTKNYTVEVSYHYYKTFTGKRYKIIYEVRDNNKELILSSERLTDEEFLNYLSFVAEEVVPLIQELNKYGGITKEEYKKDGLAEDINNQINVYYINQ